MSVCCINSHVRLEAANLLVGMNPISFEERSTILEVKMNKIHFVSSACGLQPGVQAKDTAKTFEEIKVIKLSTVS